MNDARTIIFTGALSALVLVGAGCTGNTSAIPASQYNSESALSNVPDHVGGTPPIAPQAADQARDATAEATPGAEGQGDEHMDDNAMNEEHMATEKPPVPTAFPGILPQEQLAGLSVTISTAKGDITFDILGEEGPRAASNFVALARSGFYDGLTFHRVEPGFVIQGGDPAGNGTGGPGYKFEDDPVSLNYDAGIVAMANAGPNTNGSQFFIMLEDTPLPKNYSIFGRVTSGMDVVRSIRVGDKMDSVTVNPAR